MFIDDLLDEVLLVHFRGLQLKLVTEAVDERNRRVEQLLFVLNKINTALLLKTPRNS